MRDQHHGRPARRPPAKPLEDGGRVHVVEVAREIRWQETTGHSFVRNLDSTSSQQWDAIVPGQPFGRSIGYIATTSAGGSQAAAKTDWQPLAGREVWILLYVMLDETDSERDLRRLEEWIKNRGGAVTAREVRET